MPMTVLPSNVPPPGTNYQNSASGVTVYLSKETGTVETLSLFLDGSGTAVGFPTPAYTNVPDGYVQVVLYTENGAVAPGAHTLVIKGMTSNVTVSTNITV